MNDTQNLRLQIAEVGEQILGENLLGMQVGNEPDLYAGCVVYFAALRISEVDADNGAQTSAPGSGLFTVRLRN